MENVNLPSVATMATITAIGGTVVGIGYLVKNSIRYSGAPPGPRRVPILGNLELTPEDGKEFNDSLQKVIKKYSPICCMYIGHKPIVIINDYDLLKEAFVTNGINMAGRPDSAMTLAYNPGYPHIKGIIDSSYSEEWKAQRNTALTILRNLGWGKSSIENKIQIESEAVLEELEKQNGVPFDPATLIGTCVANIICALLFGERFQFGDKEFNELLSATDALLEAVIEDPASDYIPLVKLLPSYWTAQKKMFKAGDDLIAFYRKRIQQAREKLALNDEPADFVSCYLKEIETMHKVDSRIKEDWTIQHVSDFFLAGAETTATTLRWGILFMANNQEVQQKVYEEISSKIKQHQTITLKDRELLPYTDATIMEVQRVASLVPIGVPHEAMTDTTIGGYKIPKGTEVWGNIYGILKDPKTFPQPEKFKPERFLNEKLDTVQRLEQWIPFSIGRRTCLGEQLARQELLIFFTNIIRTFKILPPEGVEYIEYEEVFKFVLKPSPYQVRLIKR